jgi:hypothetical protein
VTRSYMFNEKDRAGGQGWSEYEEELRTLFRNMSADLGFITIDGLVHCLNRLGCHQTYDFILFELHTLHPGLDHTLSFSLFKQYMNFKFMNDSIFSIHHLLDDIKHKLQKAHPTDGLLFDLNQFSMGLKNVCKEFTQEEEVKFFLLIAGSRNAVISIDSILGILKNPPTSLYDQPVFKNSLFKIKKSLLVLISEVMRIINSLPENFCLAFSRMNMLKLENLPSESIIPRLLPNTLGYNEIFPDYTDPKTGISYPVKPIKSKLNKVLTLKLATGVPLPSQNQERNGIIIARELRCTYFDRNLHKFIGSTTILKADWDINFEDRWTFGEKGLPLIVKADATQNLCLIFEFVAFITEPTKGTEIQISCGWSSYDVENMGLVSTEVRSPILGGSPIINSKIRSSDIRTGRGTFMGKIAKFFSGDIKSEICFDLKEVDKLGPNTTVSLANVVFHPAVAFGHHSSAEMAAASPRLQMLPRQEHQCFGKPQQIPRKRPDREDLHADCELDLRDELGFGHLECPRGVASPYPDPAFGAATRCAPTPRRP